MTLDRYATDVVAFIDDLIRVNELGQPFRLLPHQREILRLAFAFDADGRLPWETIVYSCPKKSGKTAIEAAVTAWWAYTQNAPNEIYILANDQEQATSRVFKALAGLIRHNPALAESAEIQTRTITVSNGTTVTALASEYAGAAGSNHGLTAWDELWAYGSERSRRLWEELTPVPTRRNSIRFIATYAGFDGESPLLWDLYKQGVGLDEHPDGQGARLHPTLPIYGNVAARVFAYWDHEGRMPWQTPDYYDGQRRTLRLNAWDRLHGNRWGAAESPFVTAEQYAACLEPTWSPLDPTMAHPLWVGVDASTKRDSTAVVAVLKDEVENLIVVARHRIWTPRPDRPLDLEAVEAYCLDLARQYDLRTVRCDPYQFHGSMQRLRQHGLPIEEYPQTEDRLTRIGQTLYDVIRERRLVVYPSDELRAHVLAASAKETPHGFRIVKTVATKKIDACVALAMAAHAATTAPVWAEPRLFALGG